MSQYRLKVLDVDCWMMHGLDREDIFGSLRQIETGNGGMATYAEMPTRTIE